MLPLFFSVCEHAEHGIGLTAIRVQHERLMRVGSRPRDVDLGRGRAVPVVRHHRVGGRKPRVAARVVRIGIDDSRESNRRSSRCRRACADSNSNGRSRRAACLRRRGRVRAHARGMRDRSSVNAAASATAEGRDHRPAGDNAARRARGGGGAWTGCGRGTSSRQLHGRDKAVAAPRDRLDRFDVPTRPQRLAQHVDVLREIRLVDVAFGPDALRGARSWQRARRDARPAPRASRLPSARSESVRRDRARVDARRRAETDRNDRGSLLALLQRTLMPFFTLYTPPTAKVFTAEALACLFRCRALRERRPAAPCAGSRNAPASSRPARRRR